MNGLAWRAAAFACALLAACGGGGGDGSPVPGPPVPAPPVPPPPPPPPEPLRVASVAPADASSGVARNEAWRVSFNHALAPDSVGPGSLSLSDEATAAAVPGTVVVDAGATALRFVPDRPLGLLRRYAATVHPTLRDTAGQALAAAHHAAFTTADGSFAGATEIDAAPSRSVNSGGDLRLAVAPDGRAIAVWTEFDGPSMSLHANRYDPATQRWGIAQQLSDPGVPSMSPAVAMDAAGNAIVVYLRADGTRHDVHARRFDAVTGTWGSSEAIEADTSAVGEAVVAMDAAGHAIALWAQGSGGIASIVANRYDASSGRWGAARIIEFDDSGTARAPQLAIDASGDAVAVWVQHDAGFVPYVHANRFDASSGAWGTPQRIEVLGDAHEPQVAVDRDGHAVAAWLRSNAGVTDLHAARLDAGSGTWSAPQLLENSGGTATAAQLAGDGRGNVFVVWTQGGGADDLLARRFDAATLSWGAPQVVDAAAAPAGLPALAMDAAGNAMAFWSQHDGVQVSLFAARYSAIAGAWAAPQPVESANAGMALGVRAAADAAGQVVAGWVQDDGVRFNAMANAFR